MKVRVVQFFYICTILCSAVYCFEYLRELGQAWGLLGIIGGIVISPLAVIWPFIQWYRMGHAPLLLFGSWGAMLLSMMIMGSLYKSR